MYIRQKTNPGMLPQSPALESISVDNPGVGTKQGAEAIQAPGMQHGRGEMPVTPKDVAGAFGRDLHRERPCSGNRAPRVFVLDKHKKPLDPCTQSRAQELLKKGRARVHKTVPFTIRLIDRTVEKSVTHEFEIEIDPGSKTTGLAVSRVSEHVDAETGEITTRRDSSHLLELEHRGAFIHKKMQQRRNYRRRRRTTNLRYRAPRFNNRSRKPGWLAPSIQHRVDTTVNWVDRIRHLAPITRISCETVRFNMQKLTHPEISGTGYQQGTLFECEVRQYLLTKYNYTCVYCGTQEGPFNIDHIHPRAKGGSNRVSNLALACVDCNQAKGSMWVEDFVTDPARLTRIKAGLKRPLRDAAAVNSTRNALSRALKATGLQVVEGTGGQTKWNRKQLGVPKEHCLDALCVGVVDAVSYPGERLCVKATGRGQYARTTPDKYGFPRLYRPRHKQFYGYATGDLVKAVVPRGKRQGTHTGRVTVRARGYFNVGPTQGVSHKYCSLLQRGDGYAYTTQQIEKI